MAWGSIGRVVRAVAVERTWPIALLFALATMGPVLLPGMVLNLDLVLVPQLDVPNGVWGLGPELPRRLPLWVPISLLSPIIPATVVGKALLVGQVVLGWTGMARLHRDLGVFPRNVIGALYVLGPFFATRAVVGHYMITIPLAMLPWVFATLVRPGRSLERTLLAAAALGFAGHFGGSIALFIVVTSVILGRSERWAKAIGVTLFAQAAWIVPGVAVWATAAPSASSGVPFATSIDGLRDLFRVLVGGGFWNGYYDVAGTGDAIAVAGLVVLVLAVVGSRSLPREFGRVLAVTGAIALVVALASGVGPIDGWVGSATTNPVLGVWRETHRLFGVAWFWLVPAAVRGAVGLETELTRRGHRLLAGATAMVPLGVGLVLALPSLWAYGGRLESVRVPEGWVQARAIVRDEPGTVLALPWRQYFNLQVDGSSTRRVLHPMPLYLGGDVVTSSDNQLGVAVRERGDPREAWLDPVIDRLEAGEDVGAEIASAGVRWIVVLDTPHRQLYAGLDRDARIERVLDSPSIDVYGLADWPGLATDEEGNEVTASTLGPISLVDRDAATWFAPASSGWRRGWSRTSEAEVGVVSLPPGGRLIWNVATLPALVGQVALAGAVAWLGVRRLRSLRTRAVRH